MATLKKDLGKGGERLSGDYPDNLYTVLTAMLADITALRATVAKLVTDVTALNTSHSKAKDDLEAVKAAEDFPAVKALTLTVTDVTLTAAAPAALTLAAE